MEEQQLQVFVSNELVSCSSAAIEQKPSAAGGQFAEAEAEAEADTRPESRPTVGTNGDRAPTRNRTFFCCCPRKRGKEALFKILWLFLRAPLMKLFLLV